MNPLIRPRAEEDMDECVRLLNAVHCGDCYPTHWPDDPRAWLSPRGMLDAWVAEIEGRIIGHVALRDGASEANSPVWSDALGLPMARIAAVTRLFVSSEQRGSGVGGKLLDTASRALRRRGLHPAIDVVETNRDAIRLYEAHGWKRVASEPWIYAREAQTRLHYYVAPWTDRAAELVSITLDLFARYPGDARGGSGADRGAGVRGEVAPPV